MCVLHRRSLAGRSSPSSPSFPGEAHCQGKSTFMTCFRTMLWRETRTSTDCSPYLEGCRSILLSSSTSFLTGLSAYDYQLITLPLKRQLTGFPVARFSEGVLGSRRLRLSPHLAPAIVFFFPPLSVPPIDSPSSFISFVGFTLDSFPRLLVSRDKKKDLLFFAT